MFLHVRTFSGFGNQHDCRAVTLKTHDVCVLILSCNISSISHILRTKDLRRVSAEQVTAATGRKVLVDLRSTHACS